LIKEENIEALLNPACNLDAGDRPRSSAAVAPASDGGVRTSRVDGLGLQATQAKSSY
jgi:hypothetical protein